MEESLLGSSLVIVGGAILALVIIFIGLTRFVSKNYIKVAPNKVAVFFGRKNVVKDKDGHEIVKGFRVVTGGAKFRIPFVESVEYLDLNVFSIDIEVREAPNKDGVPVTLRAVANVKIKPEEAALMAACERFLGRSPEEIKAIAHKNLEGHLRSIVGRMTIEQLVSDRTTLNSEVLNDAGADLLKMGLGVDLLTVSEINDKYGYIDQLGKKRTAEVVRDAEIGKAVAEKESTIQTTGAQRLATEEANKNKIAVAESNQLRDVKQAEFDAKVATQQAIAENAKPISDAKQQQLVIAEQTQVQKIKIEKETEVAQAEAVKTEKQLLSTVVKPAEAKKTADIINAEAEKQVAITKAEGQVRAIEMVAEAEKKKRSLEGQGDAEAIQFKMVAEAEGIKAKLLAEAEGVLKKAEAYEKLDETGKLLQILEVVERVLPDAIKEFAGVMGAAAAPLGNIKDVKIIDFGGNGQTGGSSLSRFGQIAPEMVMKFASALQGVGINPTELFQKLGIDLSDGFSDPSKSEKTKKEEKKEEKEK